MDRNKCRLLTKEITDSLNALVKTHGCTVACGPVRFSDSMMRFKIEVTDEGAVKPSVSVPLFPVGYTFDLHNRTYKVSGYRAGRDKTWVIALRQPDGKAFRFDPIRNCKILKAV